MFAEASYIFSFSFSEIHQKANQFLKLGKIKFAKMLSNLEGPNFCLEAIKL